MKRFLLLDAPLPRLMPAYRWRRQQIIEQTLLSLGLLASLGLASCSGGQRFGAPIEQEPTQTPNASSSEPGEVTLPSEDDSSNPGANADSAGSPTTEGTDNTPGSTTDDAATTNEPALTEDTTTADGTGDTTSNTNSQPVPDADSGLPAPDPVPPGVDCGADTACPPEAHGDAMVGPPPVNGTPDAGGAQLDECPEHPSQFTSGPCGCGFPVDLSCDVFKSHLIHRYSFESTGADVIDSISGANGRAIDTSLDGSGAIEFNGRGAYVELPSELFSGLARASFEVWVRWDGGDANQRVFNFGTPGNDNDRSPSSYLSLSPSSGDSDNITVQFRTDDNERGERLYGHDPLARDVVQHVVVVINEDLVELYVEGEIVNQTHTHHRLNQLRDAVNWLGRPLYDNYPAFAGALYEFRVYDVPLTSEQVGVNSLLGPDAVLPAAP